MARPAARRAPGKRVAVLGAGSWGTTFAKILADGGADVVLWARRPELAREIQEAKRNSDYLPGINLPIGLRATSRLDLALAGAEQVYVSVPSQTLRENLIAAEPHLHAQATIVSLMKGVEKATGHRMSEGLLLAFDAPDAATRERIIAEACKEGLLVLPCGENSVRLRPALDATRADTREALERIDRAIARAL